MDDKLNLKDALNAFEQLKELTTESVAETIPAATNTLTTEPSTTAPAPLVAETPAAPTKIPAAFQNTSIKDPKLIEALVEFHNKHNPARASRAIIRASEATEKSSEDKETTATHSSEFKPAQGQNKATFNAVEIPIVEASPKPTSPLLSRMVRTTRPILR